MDRALTPVGGTDDDYPQTTLTKTECHDGDNDDALWGLDGFFILESRVCLLNITWDKEGHNLILV